MRTVRARATSTPEPATVRMASTSCTLRPGRTSSVATARGSSGIGRSSSTVSRATMSRSPSGPGTASMARARSADGGPPCRARGSQGPRDSSVGRNVEPSGSKSEPVTSGAAGARRPPRPGDRRARRGRARSSGSTTNLEKPTSTNAPMRVRTSPRPDGTRARGSWRSGRRRAMAARKTSGTAPVAYGISTPKCSGSIVRPCAVAVSSIELAARGGVLRRDERGKPPVAEPADATQLGRREAAEPHVGRRLDRLGQDPHARQVEPLTVVVDAVLEPQAPDERQRLVEPRRPLGPGDAERLLLVDVGDAEPERRQEPAVREPVEAGHLLGDQNGVPAGQDHDGRAELETRGAAGGEGHGDDGVGGLTADPLGDPQAVEAELLHGVDGGAEPDVVHEGAHTEPEADPDLHRGEATGCSARTAPKLGIRAAGCDAARPAGPAAGPGRWRGRRRRRRSGSA